MDGFFRSFGGPGSAAECTALIVDAIGYAPERVHIHEGWFEDTIEPMRRDVGDIAILRLDCDYYRATKYCLEELFDQVVAGGFVIVDDYGCYEGCRRAVDEVLAKQPHRYFLNHADADCRYLIKA